MRTTMNTVYSQIQGNLNRLTTDINKLNNQVSSGNQMSKISDNPLNLTGALNLRTVVSELDQYSANITQGNNIIGIAESTLSQLKEVGLRGKLLTTQALGPAVGSDGMAAMAAEIKNLLAEAVTLGNTQVAGKYIFGGYRTTRYNTTEPAPFIQDKGNGYWINGATQTALPNRLTAAIPAAAPPLVDLAAGELLLNGVDIAPAGLALTPPVLASGLNMAGANSLATAINATTNTTNLAATAATADTTFAFTLNGAAVNVSVPNGSNPTAVATLTAAAINATSASSGVTAEVGDGTNGGVADAVIFKNSQTGNITPVTIAGLTILPPAAVANPGFGNASQVSASLTTLYSLGAATAATADSTFSFDLNGIAINVDIPLLGSTPADVAQRTVDAINAQGFLTGVSAVVGDGANGGVNNAVVFKNRNPGDPSNITLANLVILPPAAVADPGFGVFVQAANATHNTGEISLSSPNSFTLATTDPLQNDTRLSALGLGGGNIGFQDTTGDGQLLFGRPLGSAALKINNITVPVSTPDGLSSKFADASAAAKAAAINAIQAQTMVTATVVPASTTAIYPVTGGTLGSNDLSINGHVVFAVPTVIENNDPQNTLLRAINAVSAGTGVFASRDADGILTLSAIDGRNIEIETSSAGDTVTHLNDGDQRDSVHFGSVQLSSLSKFTLESPVTGTANNPFEQGLGALGLSGGQDITGESTDSSNDGKIDVFTVRDQTGSVRYAGDRASDLEIQIGTNTTMTVNENGQRTIADSGVFTVLQKLQDNLLGQNFTEVNGFHQASNNSALLNSRATGLEPATLLPEEELFSSGTFTVTVTDHAYEPPIARSMNISVEPAVDTLDDVTQRLNGIPHLSAAWSSDGHLTIKTTDPQRYTMGLSNDGSNFLEATGTSTKFMQQEALGKSLADFDTLANNLSNHISNLGARANRVQTQTESYSNLILATKENLSELQDTDIIQAIMDLQAKQVGYQAALSVASKTMKLSLVDYL